MNNSLFYWFCYDSTQTCYTIDEQNNKYGGNIIFFSNSESVNVMAATCQQGVTVR